MKLILFYFIFYTPCTLVKLNCEKRAMARLLCFILVKTNAKIYQEIITFFKITNDMKISITLQKILYVIPVFSKGRVKKMFAGYLSR